MIRSIMLHGILQRSGTNLLNEILLLSPDVTQPVLKIRENWFLHHSDYFYEYADKLFEHWSDAKWQGDDFCKQGFYRQVGDAFLNYIGQNNTGLPEKMLISKTPSVRRLARNFEMFPESKLIIITRDPRDVAASAFGTWGSPIRSTVHEWNEAAVAIADFESMAETDTYMLLRYEDLITDQVHWVKQCLSFLGLPHDNYPWSKLEALPVFGSSDDKGKFEIKAATDSFQPVNRWESLPAQEKDMFAYLNDTAMSYFGYVADNERNSLPPLNARRRTGADLAADFAHERERKPIRSGRKAKFRKALKLMAEALIGSNER